MPCNPVLFAPGELAIRVQAEVASKNEAINGLVVDAVVLNEGTSVFSVEGETIRIVSAVFTVDDHHFTVSTPSCSCTPVD